LKKKEEKEGKEKEEKIMIENNSIIINPSSTQKSENKELKNLTITDLGIFNNKLDELLEKYVGLDDEEKTILENNLLPIITKKTRGRKHNFN